MKSNIGIFVNTYLPSSETFIYNRISHFKQYNPIVLCRKKEVSFALNYEQTYSFIDSKFWSVKKFIEDQIRKNDLKLLQVHHSVNAFVTLGAAKKADIPQVSFFHGSDIFAFKDIFFKLRLWHLLRNCDYFVVPCEYTRQKLLEIGGRADRILVNYAGVDMSTFTEKTPEDRSDDYTLFMAGRLIEVKGMQYGIEAFKKFYDTYKKGKLVIVGSGPLLSMLQACAKGYPVEFAGQLAPRDLAMLMKKSDVVLVPSIHTIKGNPDNCPNVVKEAMSCGLPVIGSKIAGIPELITNKKTGFLFQEKNTDELFNHIDFFYRYPEKRHEFGLAGRAIAEFKFNLLSQMAELEKFYQGIIG